MLTSRGAARRDSGAKPLCGTGGRGSLGARLPLRVPMHRLVTAALAATIILLAGCTAAPPAPPAGGAPPKDAAQFNVIGRADAPLTIMEFTDLQCPYCARHATETFPRLKREYVDTGKVRYASRDLPLPFHRYALPAAVASRCAGEQGRFWEFREALFASQSQLGSAPYGRIAGELGLDVERLEACRADGRQEANVQADIALAGSVGIRSTPTFVIGRVVNGEFQGEQFSGAQPFEVFKSRIDALLAAPH